MIDSPAVRLDVWLDVACLFKTRSEAQKACRGGKVEVNDSPAKPHRAIKAGDRLTISRPFGRKQTVIVRAVEERHRPKAEARTLYEDTTPPFSAEELAVRRLERQWRASQDPVRAPNKRERRVLLQFKRRD